MEPQIFRDQLDGLAEQLEQRDPNPAASWVGESRTLDAIKERCVWLLDNHAGIESISDSETTARRVRLYLLDRSAAGAALLDVAGRSKEAGVLLSRCAEHCPDIGDQRLYQAGVADLSSFSKLVRASWLLRHNQLDEARRLGAALASAAPPIAELGRRIAKTPTPINGAPALFTINGCGVKFYGNLDHETDGSYTTIRFATLIFIPIIPIDAYNVTDHGDQYQIHGKVPLGLLMRVWQYGLLALLALVITFGVVSSYLDSPERHLRLAIDEVAQLESSDPEAALERYEQLAIEYNGVDDDTDLLPVVQGWVRMATAQVPDPITPAAVDPITGIIERYAALPGRVQNNELAEPFVDRLLDWSDQLDTDTPEGADASLELLIAADRFAPPSRRERVDRSIAAARMALATQLAVDWPLEALRQYARLAEDEPKARDAMGELIAALPDSPTLFADIAPELRVWGAEVDPAESARAGELANRGLALANDPERALMLQHGAPAPDPALAVEGADEGADEDAEQPQAVEEQPAPDPEQLAVEREAQLRAALEADPTDQPVVVALADLHRSRGQLDEAAAQLEVLGKPGLMTHDAQYLLASIERDRGHVEQAAALLEQMLRNRLPAFMDARRAFDTEITRLQDQLIARAEQGNIPAQHKAKLLSENEDVARAAFSAWLSEELERSGKLTTLQDEYQRQSDIVPVAILLGTVQLERARTATGEQREQLLDSAQSTFLSFRSEAGGLPDYHLSLGQVFFRLGKTEQAQAEFQHLLDDPAPGVQLLAAAGYRALGQFEQAREISETVYETSADQPGKHQAAVFRSLLAHDIDERRMWLQRGNQQDEYVRTSLLDVEADALRRDGKFAAADKKYAEVYSLYAAQAERQHGSFNNAALTLVARHACTGELRHVDDAVALMQGAVADSPDDGIVLGNYATVLDFRAQLELLDRFVPTKGLRISAPEVSSLLVEISRSSKHDELLAAVQGDPMRVRALDTWTRLETIAPQMTVPYMGQYEWQRLADDSAATAKMLERLRLVGGLDTSDGARATAEYVDGTNDEQGLQELTTRLEARAAAEQLGKRAKPATRAVLRQLDGDDLYQRSRIQQGEAALADARAAVQAYEDAQELWAEGLSTSSLASALVLVAVLEIEAEDPSVTEQWRARVRGDGFTLTLVDLRAEGAPLLNKLAAHSEFVRSVELRRAAPDASLTPMDLLIAEMIDDQTLRARALEQTARPAVDLGFEVLGVLAPYDTSSTRTRAWLVSARG
ncbi:hypothetical protein [Enhygromyxa salina]|uniref:Tetratricopeptide repeat protein n=1 Tax=Enhygromyxa salina TaxID=215803 RepID=A0A2S9YLV3_9BACT|nr:hypothetical protein [Enhygromyxa salina]PRQ06060.1 hypothetical protein ENSA7_43220 [Enhygromyxa salina]